MLVTKNAAELCVLLINELYGQLPSRIFADLLSRGRSTVAQLAQHTSLNQRQVRHGIVVLIQLNLVFHYTDADSGVTHYEANPRAAYNLARTGKILDMVRSKYGQHAHALVHEVLLNGHMRISELVEAWEANRAASKEAPNGSSHNSHSHVTGNGLTNGAKGVEADDRNVDPSDLPWDTLAQLLAAGILEPLSPTMYQPSQDLRSAIEQEVMADYPIGIRGSRQKDEFDKKVLEQLRAIQSASTKLKRKLEGYFGAGPSSKRRRLANGSTSRGFGGAEARFLLQEELDTAVRVNYDKCTVELRNLKLERYAEDAIGETTAQVYATLLAVLGTKISRCQGDDPVEADDEHGDLHGGPRVTTQEVFEQLSSSIDVSSGIGMPSRGDVVDFRLAERIHKYPPRLQGSTLKDTLEEGEEIVGSDDEDYDYSGQGAFNSGLHGSSDVMPGPNGSGEVKTKAKDGVPTGMQRLHQMRQHLLVLAESRQGFVRHCGSRDFGEWTVDFEPLIQYLKHTELDTLIENRFGRQGLRLTRILREKGKIDDKTLPTMALMKKPDVHVKMAEMEMAGFLDVQEVPRDNNRAASRTIFFWFFDLERTLQRTLDNTYKSMVRCLQRLDVERAKKKNVLAVAERKDVQGMEEEKLRGDVYKEYVEFLELEKRLVGQVGRLDDLVAVLRDY
ncbi:RNA polymerase III subunit RPC82-domain-containing protein [Durotheca rogersii]|uniref:RNA polymerase III subunit RPC82-domain-containing protein n=1 Tax=Durotheca rogersii TaxID=419775 RepID=UPI0022206936|nr:RNA polymerase III subunit RPC82-domain-containing protein [Durotheca rogersii]KAI5862264.1 RNA polymerase III subunit RPC82-domain-containing protein [Durotheca rogersii]